MLAYLENRQVYQRTTAAEDWQEAPVADIVDLHLRSAAGTMHAWFLDSPGSETALLYFHGNAGNLSHRGGVLVKLRQLFTTNVLIVDYPGYGKSEGKPSETGCYASAQAAYDWLVRERRIEPRQILLFGASLGGGVAVDLASRLDHRALVLVKTFTSLPDLAQHLHPWLPVRWILRNKFDNLSKLPRCRRPIFIGQAPDDDLVPFRQGQQLFEAANEPRELFRLPGGHNDGLPEEFFEALLKFLDQHAASKQILRP